MKTILFAFLLCYLCHASLQHLKAKMNEADGRLAPLKEKVLAPETGVTPAVSSAALVQVGGLCCDPATEPYDYPIFTFLEAEAKTGQRPWCWHHACCPTTGLWVCSQGQWDSPTCTGGLACHSPFPCCSPLQRPGTFTNAPCAAGSTEICCRDGSWGCGNSATGVYTCGGVQTTGPFSTQCWDCSGVTCPTTPLNCPVSQQYYEWMSCCKTCVNCGENYASLAGSDCSASQTCPSGYSCNSGNNLLPGGVYQAYGLCCKNLVTRPPGGGHPPVGTISL